VEGIADANQSDYPPAGLLGGKLKVS